MYCQEGHLVYITNENVYQKEKFRFEYVELSFSNSNPMYGHLHVQG